MAVNLISDIVEHKQAKKMHQQYLTLEFTQNATVVMQSIYYLKMLHFFKKRKAHNVTASRA